MDHVPLRLKLPNKPTEYPGGLTEAAWHASGVEVGIAFERESSPPLRIGEPVELSIDIDGAQMSGHGRVHGRRENEAWTTYRVVLDREGTLQLGSILNRREAVRVRPVSGDQVFVDLEWSNGKHDRLPLYDLSGVGLSILVDDPLERRLMNVYALRFELQLAPDEAALILDGYIRSRNLEGSQVVLGIHFDAENTPNFGVVQDRIFRFVSARYRRQIEASGLAG